MYDYRRLSVEAQQNLLDERRANGAPLHNVAHRINKNSLYLLTAANFEHQPISNTVERRDEFAHKLLSRFVALPNSELFGWCLLPNHYHLLARIDLSLFEAMIRRLHNGTSTQWNREDKEPGRRVWFSYSDRDIRSERHFWVALNYIHANAVKHGYVKNAFDWPWSSVHDFAGQHGENRLRQLWRDYPVLDFGKKWDGME